MKWFKHDSDANLDAKLQNVLLDYGLEGYGLMPDQLGRSCTLIHHNFAMLLAGPALCLFFG